MKDIRARRVRHTNKVYDSYDEELSRCCDELTTVIKNLKGLHRPQDTIIVFDIDRTILWYNRGKEIVERLHPVIDVYNFCLRLGFTISFITARREKHRENTIAQLKEIGITGYSDLFLQPEKSAEKTDTDCVCYYKESARRQIEETHKKPILLNIGDQNTDLVGGHFMIGWKLPHRGLSDCKHL